MIWFRFVPSVTGQNALGDLLRDLLALPVGLGGLGIINPVVTSGRQFSASTMVTGSLTSMTVSQASEYPLDTFYEQM